MPGSLLLAIADDLTGALETGAQLAEEGIRCAVTADGAVIESSALVVNAATRHLHAGAVANKIASIIERARALVPPQHIYLKTDSTLRGPIAESISALLRAFPDSKVLYAPAYPALGRTVRDGAVFVDGIPVSETDFARDQLTPVVESSVLRMLDGACGSPPDGAGELLLRPDCRVVVVDGASDDDLDHTARQMRATQLSLIAAGTGGFVRPWARSLRLPREPPLLRGRARSGLIIVGSRHSRSRLQVLRAAGRGVPVFVISPQLPACDVASALQQRRWAILITDDTNMGDPAAIAAASGHAVREILRRSDPEALIVFGGDTASAILDALGCPVAYPYGELLPGVPVSRTSGPREFVLVTKAGGFGNEDVVDHIIRKLEGGS